MATVRLMAKHWDMVSKAISTEIKRQEYRITKTKQEILRLPIEHEEIEGTLDQKIADIKKTILADYEYKVVHPNTNVQNNLTLNQLEELKNRYFELERKIHDLNATIEKYIEIQYFVDAASTKQDGVFDKDVHIPKEKTPFFEMHEMTPEEEFKWKCIEQMD